MRLVVTSDTHNQHSRLKIPKGDVFIHCGDFTHYHFEEDARKFLQWVQDLKGFKHKIVIAGNHDIALADEGWRGHLDPLDQMKIGESLREEFQTSEAFHYLEDESVLLDGVRFYGTPWTPTFGNWAFMKDRGPALRRHWSAIPEDVDVLITHGPPFGILDVAEGGDHVGCEDLASHARRTRPKVHFFGHIHPSYGEKTEGNTHYVNAAATRPHTKNLNPPVVLTL